jgi:uncharacterized protein YjiS (DUF1127 family)
MLQRTKTGNALNRTEPKGYGHDDGHRCQVWRRLPPRRCRANRGHLAETISGTWTDYRTYRATLAELKRLTTRQLNDAGLSRADLRRIAFEAVYGR